MGGGGANTKSAIVRLVDAGGVPIGMRYWVVRLNGKRRKPRVTRRGEIKSLGVFARFGLKKR